MNKRSCEVKESLKLGDSGTPVAIFPGLRQSVTDLRPADTKMGLNFNDVSYHRGLRSFWMKLTHNIYC